MKYPDRLMRNLIYAESDKLGSLEFIRLYIPVWSGDPLLSDFGALADFKSRSINTGVAHKVVLSMLGPKNSSVGSKPIFLLFQQNILLASLSGQIFPLFKSNSLSFVRQNFTSLKVSEKLPFAFAQGSSWFAFMTPLNIRAIVTIRPRLYTSQTHHSLLLMSHLGTFKRLIHAERLCIVLWNRRYIAMKDAIMKHMRNRNTQQ